MGDVYANHLVSMQEIGLEGAWTNDYMRVAPYYFDNGAVAGLPKARLLAIRVDWQRIG